MDASLTGSAILAVAVFATGCAAGSRAPVSVPEGTEVDPAAYLGTWRMETFGTVTMTETITLTVEAGSGFDVSATFDFGDEQHTYYITPTSVTTHTVIMSKAGEVFTDPREDESLWRDWWEIGTVRLEDGGDTLIVGSMSEPHMAEAVATGVLTGSTFGIDAGDAPHTNVDVSPEVLRSYLESHPEALDRPPHLRFARVAPEGGIGMVGPRFWLIAAVLIMLGTLGGLVYLRGRW